MYNPEAYIRWRTILNVKRNVVAEMVFSSLLDTAQYVIGMGP